MTHMMRGWATLLLLSCFFSPAMAVERAPRITDREIVERLTKLEEGQNALRIEIQANARAIEQLRQDMNAQFSRIDAQFNRIDAQFNRIDAQFDRVVNMMLGILGAFTALAAAAIGLMLWDRRTATRPFEERTKKIEDEIVQDRQRVYSLLEALRALSHSDEKVAEVLRRFHLLS
jgi:predicted  nucleic acid-binding Zn-ribbon protein